MFLSRTSPVSLEEYISGNQRLILIFQVTFSSVVQDPLVKSETVRTREPPVFGPIDLKMVKTQSSQPTVLIWLLAEMLTKASASKALLCHSIPIS